MAFFKQSRMIFLRTILCNVVTLDNLKNGKEKKTLYTRLFGKRVPCSICDILYEMDRRGIEIDMSKLIQMIEDPAAAKELKSNAQKAAVLGAIAIAFGITEQDFTQVISKIKAVLPK